MAEKPNLYDKHDVIRREAVIIAGPLKMATYTVRDVETDERSKLQFHATFGDTVMAVMGEESAKLFAHFINNALGVAAEER